MRSSIAPKIILALSEALLVFAILSVTHGQDIKGSKGTKKTTPSPSTPTGPKGGRPVRSKPTIVEKIVRVAPNTGAMVVVAEPNARVRVEDVKDGEVLVDATIPPNGRSLSINNIDPGQYRVFAELAGHKPDTKQHTVNKGKTDSVDMILVPITYDFTVRVNAPSGEIVYPKGNGESAYIRFSNSVAVLRGLRPGSYKVEVRPDDPTYETAEVKLNVSETSVNHAVVLKRTLTTLEFNWASASDWEMPGGWGVSSGKVAVNGRGMALPRDENLRHYQDFQLISVVRMKNGVAASFVLRAEDQQNYYLVQLTGKEADEPFVLRGYVVKNNVPQRFPRAFSIRNISDVLKPGKFFRVLLTMKGAQIEVKVEDSETSDIFPLGTLTDPGETFSVGAVGIAARDTEKNEVEQFVVCPAICKNTVK